MRRTLYLGTDPSRLHFDGAVVHFPIIQTIDVNLNLDYSKYNALLFTSPNAARYYRGDLDSKKLIAIGPSTAKMLPKKALLPREATQEGLISLFEKIPLSQMQLLWPRSSLSRPLIIDYLTKKKVSFEAPVLYRTEPKIYDLTPAFADFDQIVITSPSCLDSLLKNWGELPPLEKIVTLGPVTKKALDLFLKQRKATTFDLSS